MRDRSTTSSVRYLQLAVFITAVLACCVALNADDLLPPGWRSQQATTFQEWRFDNNGNPAVPEQVNNGYGQPDATVSVGAYGSGWLQQLPGFGTKTGYWDLGGSGGSITIQIDNRPEPGLHKEIWVQVTYFEDIHQAPSVQVAGGQYTGGQTTLAEHVLTGGDWYLARSVWLIDPSPQQEQIVISSDATWGSIVDQVIVDTRVYGCLVDYYDLSVFCSQWLDQGSDLDADFDNDEVVDFADYAELAAAWRAECPSGWPWP